MYNPTRSRRSGRRRRPVSEAPARVPRGKHRLEKTGGVGASDGFRPDIEGLRAVAIIAVLLYHAGLPFVPGGYVGVDVFFVISGFLMTRLLVGEIERTGSIALGRFYLRRIRRLLPAAAVTLTGVAVLTWLLLAPTQRSDIAGDLVAAGAYVVNWRLAHQAVDYLAGGWEASPVQHFWSLAVEEQFYIVWPVLILLAAWAARRTRWPVRGAVTALVVAVGFGSLAHGILLTVRTADVAYFSTLARGWEFALGGAAVLFTPRLPRPVAIAVAWVGLGCVAFAALMFHDGTPFPGWAALLPTLGTAAVLVAGASAPTRILTLAPVRHVGRISYSWYLWHWPAVIFAAAVWGDLAPWQGLVAVAAAWVPSVLTYRFVEQPFRRSPVLVRSPRLTLGLGAVSTSTAVVVGLLLPLTVQPITTKAMSEVRGAVALHAGTSVQEAADGVRPNPTKAKKDRSRNYDDGCHVERLGTKSGACVYGHTSSDTTVVLFGDSHAMQYAPAMEKLADRRNWRLVALTKSGCSPADATLYNNKLKRAYTECDTWRENSMDRIIDTEDPALVVTVGRSTYPVVSGDERLGKQASADALEQGYEKTLKRLRRADLNTVVINDNPHPDKDIPNCVSKKLKRLRDCAFDKDNGLPQDRAGKRAAKKFDDVSSVDPTGALCRDGTCPAVIGDVIVYGESTHLTATYVKTMVPWLDKQIPPADGSGGRG